MGITQIEGWVQRRLTCRRIIPHPSSLSARIRSHQGGARLRTVGDACPKLALVGIAAAGLLYQVQLHSETATPNIGGLLVHVVSPLSDYPILPDTWPLPGSHSTKISVTAAQGEYEPASFVMRATQAGTTEVLLKATDLVGPEGGVMKESVDLRVVKVWYQSAHLKGKLAHIVDPGGAPVLTPELLLKDDSLVKVSHSPPKNELRLSSNLVDHYVDITAPRTNESRVLLKTTDFPVKDSPDLKPFSVTKDSNKQVWVTVHVPDNTQPGLYKGAIHIEVGGAQVGDVGIAVDVLPFTLQPANLAYSLYYRGKFDPKSPTVSSEGKNETQLVAELTNMREHGVKNPTIYQSIREPALLARYLEMRKKLGMTGGDLYYLGRTTSNPTTEQGLASLKNDVKNLRELALENGFKRLFIYGIDEAHGDRLISEKPAWEAVHQAGGYVFAAGYLGHTDMMGPLTDLLILHRTLDRVEAGKVHKFGNRVFSYSNPQVGPEDPGPYRRNYGVELWRAGFDGAMPYAYQSSMGSTWNDFDHSRYKDLNFTYATVNGVIDTVAWEGFREGIDDVRYLSTLKYYAEISSASLDERRRARAQAALGFLKTLAQQRPENLDSLRKEVIRQIVGLAVPDAPINVRAEN